MTAFEQYAAKDLLSDMEKLIFESESTDNAIDLLLDDYYIKEENNNGL